MEQHPRDIETRSKLMRAVPVARGSHYVRHSLQAAATLAQMLEIVAAGAGNEQNEGLRALRCVIEYAAVGGGAELKERAVKPKLIFQRNESAALIGGNGGGLWIERVQAKIAIVGAIVKKTRVQNLFWRDVVLQPQKIVSGPLLKGVRARRLLLDDTESMLNGNRVGKPKAPALDWSGEREPRIPVSEVGAFLNVDARSGVGRPESPPVISVGSFEIQYACPRVRIA